MRALLSLALAFAVSLAGPAIAQPTPMYGPAPCPVNASGCVVTSTGGNTALSEAERARQAASILNSGVAAAADAALTTACNALPSTGGRVWLPAGSYTFSSTVTSCGGKSITIEGEGSGVTTIVATTSAEPISITQTDMFQSVHIKGIKFISSSAAATARAIDVIFPAVASFPAQSLTIEDVDVVSTLASNLAAPYASSYLGGVRVNGAWQARINGVSYTGPLPVGGLPVSGTSTIELQNSYNTTISNATCNHTDALVLQSAYSEYVNIVAPKAVGCNSALQITNAVNVSKGNRKGLSYYVSDGELDVFLVGVSLDTITDGWIHNNHIALGRQAGGSGVTIAASNKVIVTGNVIEQLSANITGTAITITGAGTDNFFYGNTINAATAATLDSSTSHNIVGNSATVSTLSPVPTYTDAGTSNSVSMQPGMVLLQSQAANNSGSFAFEGYSATWNEIEIRCNHIRGSVAGQNFLTRFGTGSPVTYSASAYQTSSILNSASVAAPAGRGATNDIGATIVGEVWSITANADLSLRGNLEQPGATALKNFTYRISGRRNTDDAFINAMGTSINTGISVPITGIQVLFSSGNIVAGTCSLYGIAS